MYPGPMCRIGQLGTDRQRQPAAGPCLALLAPLGDVPFIVATVVARMTAKAPIRFAPKCIQRTTGVKLCSAYWLFVPLGTIRTSLSQTGVRRSSNRLAISDRVPKVSPETLFDSNILRVVQENFVATSKVVLHNAKWEEASAMEALGYRLRWLWSRVTPLLALDTGSAFWWFGSGGRCGYMLGGLGPTLGCYVGSSVRLSGYSTRWSCNSLPWPIPRESNSLHVFFGRIDDTGVRFVVRAIAVNKVMNALASCEAFPAVWALELGRFCERCLVCLGSLFSPGAIQFAFALGGMTLFGSVFSAVLHLISCDFCTPVAPTGAPIIWPACRRKELMAHELGRQQQTPLSWPAGWSV